MKIVIWKNLSEQKRKTILQRPITADDSDVKKSAIEIIRAVRKKGDKALRFYTKNYDGIEIGNFKVSKKEINHACKIINNDAKQAIKKAVQQIGIFHKAQYPKNIYLSTAAGIVCEKQSRPIQSVGLYIPGGTAPLLSTVLMLGIPSKIAKNPTRILCTPPQKDGGINAHILYAAAICGIENIYRVGGAQAIAAMAYGTETIPKTDKIFGPGNSWVTMAKLLVAQDPNGAAFDLPAGPSEVMIIADKNANSSFIAADLLSQAEHGADSQAMLVTDDAELAKRVNLELKKQIAELPRKTTAKHALQNSHLIIADDIKTAVDIANSYAPEHLILQLRGASKWRKNILHAGSVFIGKWSPESVGDYASGTNHVLPTYGYARSYSGLSVGDFMAHVTFQKLTKKGLEKISTCVQTLADIENLAAHKRAVSIRIGEKNK